MGYTVTTPAKSKKAKREMLAFMGEHFRPAHEIFDDLEEDYDRTASGVLTEDHLSYDKGSSKMGFDYASWSQLDRYYAFNVCRWMALKVGRIRRFKKFGFANTSIPYIVYDGREAIPVVPESVWESDEAPEKFNLCDDLGVKPTFEHRAWRRNIKEGRYKKDDPRVLNALDLEEQIEGTVRKELQRLDGLWENR